VETGNEAVRERILMYLANGAGNTIQEIAVHAHTSCDSALEVLFDMAKDGLVGFKEGLWKKL